MTDTATTPGPGDEIVGALIAEPSGDLVLVEPGETISAEEGVTFRTATRAEVEEHGFEISDAGLIVPKVEAPAEVVEDPASAAAPAKRRRGTVTDRLRREAADAASPSDG